MLCRTFNVLPRPAEQIKNIYASEVATHEPASPDNLTDFDPAPLRYRQDGLTPDKQREYVEASNSGGTISN